MKKQKSSSQDDVHFKMAKDLRKKIFQIPIMEQAETIRRFEEIDALLNQLACEVLHRFDSPSKVFKKILYQIASGSTLGKDFFDKMDNEDEKLQGPKPLLQNSEKRMLSRGFVLLRLTQDPRKFAQVLPQVGFMRGVIEEAVQGVWDLLHRYAEKDAQIHSLRKKIEQSPHDVLVQTHSLRQIESLQREQLVLRETLKPRISEEEMVDFYLDLQARWECYLRLREEIIQPYYRKVFKMASDFSQSNSQTLDNFQNGIHGLMRAYKRYTPYRYAAFALIVEKWVKQAILLDLKSSINTIKIPIANWHGAKKLDRAREKLEIRAAAEGRTLTMEEIAREADMSVTKAETIQRNIRAAKVVSLNLPTTNEDDNDDQAHYGMEVLSDPSLTPENLETQVLAAADFKIVKEVSCNFNDEEKLIFAMISGCLELLDEQNLQPEDIIKEKIRQQAAGVGILIEFKTR